MLTALSDHCDETQDDTTYKFVLSEVRFNGQRRALVSALASLMAFNKSDPQVTDDLLAAVGWDTALAPLRRGRMAVRRGDFAEVLAAEAAESLDGLTVPVRKLRYQIDPNQTLPGGDVVAFLLSDNGSIDELEFIESKFRAHPRRNIAVEAHDQLAAERVDGYATTIAFIASRLRETNPTLYGRFLEFLKARDRRESLHTVALTYDSEFWDENVIDDLNDLDDHLPELWLRLFPLDQAGGLVEDVYAKLHWDVVIGDD
jgi:hypothetical protein